MQPSYIPGSQSLFSLKKVSYISLSVMTHGLTGGAYKMELFKKTRKFRHFF